MAVIGFTINEVLRDFIGQLTYTYTKYIDSDFSLKEGEVVDSNLLNYFNKFENIDELNKFIYDEAALEIFGHADQLHDNIFTKFNNFLIDIDDEEEHEIILISREISKSIPSTMFFLSKVGCKAPHIKFVKEYKNMWDDVDILITASPKAIELKPKNKMCIKVKSSYNNEIKADYELDNIIEFISDEDYRNKILNTKITNYKKLK